MQRDVLCVTLQSGNRIIIANTRNGKWFKLSKECYEILISAIAKKVTKEELVSYLEDENDRIYFNKLIDRLIDINIIIVGDEIYCDKISKISFGITHRCNLNCTHCSVDASSMSSPEILATDEVKEIIDNIINVGPDFLFITGGEPLAREDFFEIITYLKNRFSGVLSLMTNGTLINAANIDMLVSFFDGFDISLDGFDETSCSKIRGAGTFQKVIDSVKLLQSYGVKNISLSSILIGYSKQYKENFEELNRKLGTRPVLRGFVPVGRGANNIVSISQEMSNNVSGDKNVSRVIDKNNYCGLQTFACGACLNEIYLGTNGDIYPCAAFQMREFKLGNIRKLNENTDFIKDRLYFNSEGYKNFQNTLPYLNPKCKECNINLFCITCPFHTYIIQKEEKIDEYCRKKKEQYSSIWD